MAVKGVVFGKRQLGRFNAIHIFWLSRWRARAVHIFLRSFRFDAVIERHQDSGARDQRVKGLQMKETKEFSHRLGERPYLKRIN